MISDPSAMAAARLGEFERIERFLAPLAGPGGLGLRDDVALLDPPEGGQLVLTADAIVAGVHFFADDPPALVARKLLRVNLSDLAAKGAAPLGYLMTTALPEACDDAWLADFCRGLALDQAEFGIALMGGDSTATPGPACLSLTAIGWVPAGAAILRGGACPGDIVHVSGTIGDGTLGLAVRRGELAGLAAAERDFLRERYLLPQPRLGLGRGLIGLAHAMLDVSDGLVADLGHLATVSGVAAIVEAARVPVSPAARHALALNPGLLPTLLGGGDDYELVFAAPPDAADRIAALAAGIGVRVTAIGRIEEGTGVRILGASGEEITIASRGYRHF